MESLNVPGFVAGQLKIPFIVVGKVYDQDGRCIDARRSYFDADDALAIGRQLHPGRYILVVPVNQRGAEAMVDPRHLLQWGPIIIGPGGKIYAVDYNRVRCDQEEVVMGLGSNHPVQVVSLHHATAAQMLGIAVINAG